MKGIRALQQTALQTSWATRLTALVVAAYGIGLLIGVPAMGMSWDGDSFWTYGNWILEWYRSRDSSAPAVTDNSMRWYGGFYGVVCAVLGKLVPQMSYLRLYHTVTAVFSVVGLIYTARLGRDLLGHWGGLCAAVLLVATPRWTGDSMFNPVDVPFGATYVVSLFYLSRVAREMPAPPFSGWIKFGVATGICLGVRIGGLLPLAFAAALLMAWAAHQAWKEDSATLKNRAPRLLAGLATAVVLTYAFACAFWPAMLLNPFRHTLDALGANSKFPWPAGTVYFQGRFLVAADLPWTYLPVWFSITSPLVLIAGVLLAAFFGREIASGLAVRRGADAPPVGSLPGAGTATKGGMWLVLLLAIFFPPAWAIYKKATLYDGLRHFLFLLPPLCVLAACGWGELLRRAGSQNARIAVFVLIALGVQEPLRWYVRSHPYQYTYFNPLAGGLRGASRNYETEYLGLSLRTAAEWLNAHHAQLAGEETLVVQTNASWQLLAPFLAPGKVRRAEKDEPFHAFVEFYRWRPPGWHKGGQPLEVVGIYKDQVPFYRIHAGPAALGNTPRPAAPIAAP